MSYQGPYGPPPGQQQGPPPQGPPPQGPPPQYGPPPGGQQQYWGPPPRPPQGPGFGFGSNGFPPPRKKSKAPYIVIPIALLGLAVVGLLTVSTILKHNRDDQYTQPEPTYTTSAAPTPGTSTTAPTVPTVPATRTTQPKPVPTRTTTQPKPTQTTAPQPSDNTIVTKNRIYKTGVMKTVNCREPASRPTSLPNARKYYAGVLTCLLRAWPRQVTAAGGRFTAPTLLVFTGYAESPCGGGGGGGISFYCSTNRTIYMDAGTDVQFWQQYSKVSYQNHWKRMTMADTVAHEFGHHVQYMTGILTAQLNLQYESSQTKALEISRRKELQASCFGNVFLGANKSSFRITGDMKYQLDYLHSHQGDEYGTQPDHGSREVLPLWTTPAFKSRSPASCNTFIAAARLVR